MGPFAGAASQTPNQPPRMTAARFRRRALTLGLAAVFGQPACALALGLGGVVGEPVLGEALQIEVPLTGSLEGALDSNCVLVQRPSDTIDADYFPRDLAARIDKQAAGPRVLLATRSAIRQPLVQFRLSITCGYNLSRDYLVALSPRERAPAPMATASAASKPVAASQAAGAPAAAGAGTPDGIPARSIVLDRDMTLEQLARQHFPGPLRQERFMRWVAEANPQLFANAGDLRQFRLAGGTQLLIPQGVPPRRAGDYANGSSPLDRIGAAGATRQAEPTAKPKTAARTPAKGGQDRLVVGSGGSSAKDYKEAVALVQRLTGMMEQQVAAQAANEEKIRQLEAGAAELNSHIAQLEITAKQREAEVQAQLVAARKEQEDQAERAWWQMVIAVLIGGVLGAALLQGVRVLAGRRQEPDLPNDSAAPAKAETARPAPVIERAETPAAKAELPSAPAPAVRSTATLPRRPSPQKDPLDFEPPSFLQSDGRQTASAQTTAAVAEFTVQEMPDPAKAAIELANIMTSMGLTESAAQTLVDHIRENPRQSLQHWLKLLELHRINGKREDFERSSQELRQHFNVQAEEWGSPAGTTRGSLETYPHIRNQITSLWQDPGCVKYLHSLLMDNREGTRAGFPLAVAEEILLLIAVQSDAQ